MTWENCSKKGEDYPFNYCYIRLSTRGRNSEMVHLYFITDPKQKGTIQEIIDQKFGTSQVPGMRDKIYDPSVDSELDKRMTQNQRLKTNQLSVRGALTMVHMVGQGRVTVRLLLIHVHG